LVGVNQRVLEQLRRTRVLDHLEPHNVYPATPLVGEALRNAYADAERWLTSKAGQDDASPAPSSTDPK